MKEIAFPSMGEGQGENSAPCPGLCGEVCLLS